MTHHFRKLKSMYKIVNRYNYIDTSPGHYGPTQVNTMLRKKTISRIIIDIQTGLLKDWYFSTTISSPCHMQISLIDDILIYFG